MNELLREAGLPGGLRVERVPLDGGQVRVLRAGSGRPLIFLHPAAGALPWNLFHERLARSFELVVPEHPGFGGSDDFPELAGVPALAGHYRRLLMVLGLDRAALVGASLGGWLAAEIAATTPELVTDLVLLGAPGLQVAGASYPDIFARTPAETAALLFHGPPPTAPTQRPGAAAAASRHRAAAARFASDPLLHDPSLGRRLSRVTARCCVARAGNDRIVPAGVGEAYARGLGGAELVTVSDCGHALYYERPDAFADVVLRFLGGTGTDR